MTTTINARMRLTASVLLILPVGVIMLATAVVGFVLVSLTWPFAVLQGITRVYYRSMLDELQAYLAQVKGEAISRAPEPDSKSDELSLPDVPAEGLAYREQAATRH